MKSEIIVLKHIHFKFTDGSSCEYITAHCVFGSYLRVRLRAFSNSFIPFRRTRSSRFVGSNLYALTLSNSPFGPNGVSSTICMSHLSPRWPLLRTSRNRSFIGPLSFSSKSTSLLRRKVCSPSSFLRS